MVKVVYHAADGTQHASRAVAQRYERALEFLDWLLSGERPMQLTQSIQDIEPRIKRQVIALDIAERWYLLDRQAKRKRGQPHFTGENCPACGGRLEAIAGVEVCATCDTEAATRLRKAEMGELKAREETDAE